MRVFCSIAKCLGSKTVCQKLFEYTKNHNIMSQVVSDQQAISACLKFAGGNNFIRILVSC